MHIPWYKGQTVSKTVYSMCFVWVFFCCLKKISTVCFYEAKAQNSWEETARSGCTGQTGWEWLVVTSAQDTLCWAKGNALKQKERKLLRDRCHIRHTHFFPDAWKNCRDVTSTWGNLDKWWILIFLTHHLTGSNLSRIHSQTVNAENSCILRINFWSMTLHFI